MRKNGMDEKNRIARAAEAVAARDWDLPAIEKRFRRFEASGFEKPELDLKAAAQNKRKALDQVQTRAEEYCYLTRSCAKGAAIALFEAFGLGSMEMIRALSPFPGLAMSGGICGPVAGGLAALGLYFSDADPANYENIHHYIAGRRFVQEFETTFGSLSCPAVQQQLLGRAYDPFAGMDELEAFNQSGAREKCPAVPGLGARLAAEIIIENKGKNH
ncbi:MAG: C-GCAxxG-C-C family protein [Thermodesulfobacteriota bacterium]